MSRSSVYALILTATAALAEVSVREERMTIPTWETGPLQVHSVFYDAGGRGGGVNLYPYLLNETLTDRKVDKTYTAAVLENEYVKVVVMPEIGGKLFGAEDKTNGYVWLYWQKTIKPGLIAMTGAWISGGIEWNFPLAHRPSTYARVDHRLVKNPDGSATVWVGETEPIFRVRWLVGMTLFPGRSYLRCDYILVNPTDHRQPFLFWATSSTHANEYAQAQYPGDVVTGHGKHEFWNWPIHEGVDLTWWTNSPNASSYFAFNNPSDWFGAYDHRAQGGMVHVADHHTMPGKKLWTWGSGPSGRIWEEILTEGGGAYFEPQAGGWSDNQPDYHWMQPQEVRRTHDYWYPVRNTRGYHNADKDFALNTDLKDGKAFAAVYSTGIVKDLKVVLRDVRRSAVLSEKTVAISPDKPYSVETAVPPGVSVYDLHLAVYDASGRKRIELKQEPPRKVDLPPGQQDPGDPKKLTGDELYHAGEWLDRFLRPGEAKAYYDEALRRDPKDSRVNAELGFRELKHGNWAEGLRSLNIALERDADNARLYFGRGLAYQGLHKYDEAYDNFYRATWGQDCRAAAYLNLARLDLCRGDWSAAIEKTAEAATGNAGFADVYAYQAAACRLAGQPKRAAAAADKAVENDPLHFMGGYERLLALRALGDAVAAAWEKTWTSYLRAAAQNYLELATCYGNAGLYADADQVLGLAPPHPMAAYLRGYYRERAGDPQAAAKHYAEAAQGPVEYVNPHRLEELEALDAALRRNPADAHAHLFLGNLLYGKERREEGFAHWQRAVELDSKLELAVRNVAFGWRYLKKDLARSHQAYLQALALNPRDARVLLETDQVAELLGTPPKDRFALLEQHLATVSQRDDLTAHLIDLRLKAGDVANLKLAQEELGKRHFHSWEGRYGIHEAWVDVNQRLGDIAFEARDYRTALGYYQRACEYPKNLEVAPRTPDLRAHVNWNLAKVYLATGDRQSAEKYLRRILAEKYGRPQLGTYYQALGRKALGDEAGSRAALAELEARAREITSGKFEYRGNQEAIGYYLLSKALAERGASGAQEALNRALELNPEAPRLALRTAQIDYARAHQ